MLICRHLCLQNVFRWGKGKFLRQSRYLSFCASALLGAVAMFIIMEHIHISQSISPCIRDELESVEVQGQAKSRYIYNGMELENVTKSHYSLYTEAKNYGECERIKHVGYIKTYKTGSSTMSNILNRISLRYDSTLLLYLKQCKVPSPVGMTRCPLHFYPSFKKLDFEMTFDHLEYDKEFLQPMLPADTIFLSTLREPLSRLKSSLYFRGLYKALQDSDEDPVLKFLSMDEVYKNWWSQHHMYQFLKLPKKDVYNEDPEGYVKHFRKIEADIPLTVIAEYYDESLVHVRRRLCWETKDIVYLRLKSSNRGKKDLNTYNSTVIELHKQYNPVDYALYHYFNQSFHQKLRKEPSDFWEELRYFRKLNKQVYDFCHNVHEGLENDADFIINLSQDAKYSVSFEKTKWGDAFTIDAVDCALMMVNEDVFRNIHIVRQYPHVCKRATSRHAPGWYVGVNDFGVSISKKLFRIHPDFCTGSLVKNHVPIRVLRHDQSYDWPSQVPRVGEWVRRVDMYSQGMLGAINNV